MLLMLVDFKPTHRRIIFDFKIVEQSNILRLLASACFERVLLGTEPISNSFECEPC